MSRPASSNNVFSHYAAEVKNASSLGLSVDTHQHLQRRLPSKTQKQAHKHLWMHFASHPHNPCETPIIVRGEGCYIFDDQGRRYLDGMSSLFSQQIGHGRKEMAQAAAEQMNDLSFFPIWSFAHEPAVELAARLSEIAPPNLNRVFFTSSGSESVETAWKLVKQYFAIIGKPKKYKVLSRRLSYHGTTHGALSITGLPGLKQDFEPLVPGVSHIPNTNMFRPEVPGLSEKELGTWLVGQIEAEILSQGPETVAAIFVEPVQNSGGCFTAPEGFYPQLRALCDKYDILLIADETICGFGRLGTWFGSQKWGINPDIITCAKGLTSGYVPMGAVIVHDRIFEPFATGEHTFKHGYTYGGHPVAAAVALRNIDIIEEEKLLDHVLHNENLFAEKLRSLRDLDLVADVRGDGYFYAIELVRDKRTKETFTPEECVRILKGYLSHELFAHGLYCRADDRGEPVIQIAPPLIAGEEQFDEATQILREVLTGAAKLL